jgi:hypothetical protein
MRASRAGAHTGNKMSESETALILNTLAAPNLSPDDEGEVFRLPGPMVCGHSP